MKKITAFIAAFFIFTVIIIAFHFCLSEDYGKDSRSFGTWVNPYKDLSYDAVADNLGKNSMVVFGSSEFNHGKKTPFHPSNLFKNQNVDLMIIGGAYNQCLSHAVALGALEKKTHNKKVVLILSPTWFYEEGVKPENYALRFSESNYMALMENDDISDKVKGYIGSRSEKLLKSNSNMQDRVKRYNRMFVEHDSSIIDDAIFLVRKAYISDKEQIAVKTSWNSRKTYKTPNAVLNINTINWKKLSERAISEELPHKNNKFAMYDDIYNKKIKCRIAKARNSHINDSFEISPEYEDLKCFLDICNESGIEPLIVIQPLNGYWYDYTGLTKEKRQVYKDKILSIADEYSAEIADFSGEEYSKYYFEDAVHPTGEGWVKINEKIYQFYKQN